MRRKRKIGMRKRTGNRLGRDEEEGCKGRRDQKMNERRRREERNRGR